MKPLLLCLLLGAFVGVKCLECGENEQVFVKDCATCFQSSCQGDVGTESNVRCTFVRFCPEETKGSAICICKKGYVRTTTDPASPCVLKEQCPAHQAQLGRSGPTSCPENEEVFVKDCAACIQTTCDGDLSSDRNFWCTFIRFCPKETKGNTICVCKTGFVRKTSDPDSPCVPKETCPASKGLLGRTGPTSCPENEEVFVKDCAACFQTTCDGDLSSDRTVLCTFMRFCPKETKGNTICICKKGFVRKSNDADSPCVPKDQCPAALTKVAREEPIVCGENEESFARGCSICWETSCQGDWNQTTNVICTLQKFCPPDVLRYMCICKPGFVRRTSDPDSPCVPKHQCELPLESLERTDPTVCGDNEMKFVKDCSICWETSCDGDLSQKVPVVCTLQRFCPKETLGNSICICKPGYFRKNSHPAAPCVPKAECHKPPRLGESEPVCGENEEKLVKNCGTCVQNSCEKELSSESNALCTVPSQCPQHTVGQTICICKQGFVRRNNNPFSPCVPKANCPKKLDCPSNEENFLVTCKYNTCVGGPTCEKPDGKAACITQLACDEDRFMCVCKQGFVRKDGQCVPPDHCSV